MILESRTSGRTYALTVRNTGILSLARTADPNATQLPNRCLLNAARSAAFSVEVKDTDLLHPLITLRQRDLGLGRPALTLLSSNGREWELCCTVDGIYKVKSLSTDWMKAAAPILDDPNMVAWRFEVSNDGIYQVTSDATTPVRRSAKLLTSDGTVAYEITVDSNGVLAVSDPLPPAAARYAEIELIAPSGFRYLLRVDPNGVLYIDDEWQIANDQAEEWPLLLADRGGTLYCVDARFPPPIGAGGRSRTMRRPW